MIIFVLRPLSFFSFNFGDQFSSSSIATGGGSRGRGGRGDLEGRFGRQPPSGGLWAQAGGDVRATGMQESGRPTLAVEANRSLWLGGRSAGVQPPKMEKTTGPCHRLVEEKKGRGRSRRGASPVPLTPSIQPARPGGESIAQTRASSRLANGGVLGMTRGERTGEAVRVRGIIARILKQSNVLEFT